MKVIGTDPLDRRSRQLALIVASTLLGAGCLSPNVRVKPDGTFDPPTLEIAEGDAVIWSGDGSLLSNSDAIVRIAEPQSLHTREQICGAAAGGPSAAVGADPLLNFSGPERKGISGIHVLGPQGYGFIETTHPDPNANCNTVLDPADLPDVNYVTVHSEWVAPTNHLLCGKTVRNTDGDWVPAADTAQGGISQVLESVWDNPDIDGVVLRIRWSDFQRDDGTAVVTDWEPIDREFRQAVKRGKTISFNIHAGQDIPRFIFNDYDRDTDTPGLQQPPESTVTPVRLRDYASESVTPPRCGWPSTLGSPADAEYPAKLKGLYSALAEHISADARFSQALGYVKVSGLNLTTGEARLPHRCLDPDASGIPDACSCNTETWANAGYTPTALYTFYNEVNAHILNVFRGAKSLHYMLIQDGFPRVLDPANYFRDRLHDGDDRLAGTADDLGPDGVDGTSDDGYVGNGFPGPFQQTVKVLEFGRLGRFAQPGDPQIAPNDLGTGKLFVAQHSGLTLHPRDQGGVLDCDQTASHALLVDGNGKSYYAHYPAGGALPPLGGVGTKCPNQWAAEEGYRGQLIGYQTTSEIDAPAEVDSTLWNMTAGSNAAYYEMYEKAAWVIAHARGTGPGAAVLDTANYHPAMGVGFQKNLSQWGQQLHARREAIGAEQAVYPNLADPFPPFHTFRFDAPLAAGEVADFWYVNPGRCSSSSALTPYGHIRVTGH